MALIPTKWWITNAALPLLFVFCLASGRANALLPMMGMTSFKGKRPTLTEAKIAKNYLNEDELDTLNRLVSAYLDLAELQALRRKPMYMKDWIARLDDYLRMTDIRTGEAKRNRCRQKIHPAFWKKLTNLSTVGTITNEGKHLWAR